MEKLLIVSSPPHIQSRRSTEKAIRLVTIALLPSFIYSSLIFGTKALLVVLVTVSSSLLFEFIIQHLSKSKTTISDGSAGLTGLLLALTLPPGVPLWLPIIGSAFSIIVIKQLFGGIGNNIFNPALAGRAFLSICFPAIIYTAWIKPATGTLSGIDTITSSTPLMVLKNLGHYGSSEKVLNLLNQKKTLMTLFWGNSGGSIGETSSFLLIISGLFLLFVKIIDYRIVVCYLASFIILGLILQPNVNILFHLFSGGLLLGAFFMATDWVTTPITRMGRWLFGAGCGILTLLIRLYTKNPEGVCFAILLMNLLTPFIDRFTKLERYSAKSNRFNERSKMDKKFFFSNISLKDFNLLKKGNKLKEFFLSVFAYLFAALIILHIFQLKPVIAKNKTKFEGFRTILPAENFLSIIPDTLWKAIDSMKDLKGIVFKCFPQGYGGIIPITVGVDVTGRITGVFVGGEDEGFNETEGLGSLVRDTNFTNQFIGKTLSQINLREDGGEIDAITGATISSRAVCVGIKEALQKYEQLLKEGLKGIKSEIFPGADNFLPGIKDTLWYAVFRAETIGIVVYNSIITEERTIEFIAGLDNKNRITGIKILSIKDLPSKDLPDDLKEKIRKRLDSYKDFLK